MHLHTSHASESVKPEHRVAGGMEADAFNAYIRQLCVMMQTALNAEKVSFWLLDKDQQTLICLEDMPWPELQGLCIAHTEYASLITCFAESSFIEFPAAHLDHRLQSLPIHTEPNDLLMARVHCSDSVQAVLVARKQTSQHWPVNYVSLIEHLIELAAQALQVFHPGTLNWSYLQWARRLNRWAMEVTALSGYDFFQSLIQHFSREFKGIQAGVMEPISVPGQSDRMRMICAHLDTEWGIGTLYLHLQHTQFAEKSRLETGEYLYLLPLCNPQQERIGYLFLLFKQPPCEFALLQQVLKPLLPRLEAELIRYQNEAALKLSAIAFDTNKGCLITDDNLLVLKVNQAFTAITGIPEEEAVGRRLGDRYWSLSDAQYMAFLHGQDWAGSVTRMRANGESYPQWESWTAVRDELNQLRHYVISLDDLTEQIATHRRIHELAYYDELTRLPNRRKLFDAAQLMFHQKDEFGALLFIDLDLFKDINDSLGHAAGDFVLQQIAQRLQTQIPEGGMLARLGGDEFVVLYPALSAHEDETLHLSRTLAERLLAILNTPLPYQSRMLHVSASIGIALYPYPDQTAADLIKQADTAMYQAKEEGRGRIVVFQPTMQQKVDRRLHIQNTLRDALHHHELEVHYQPQHQVESGALWGVEALVRCVSIQGKSWSPEEFIPVVEETDLIIDLGFWVLEESCRQYLCWCQKGICLQQLSVNVSARQFHHPDFVEQVQKILQKTGIPPQVLMLEITESVVLTSLESTIRKIDTLGQLGVRFAIDDFGKGYSSLGYLNRLPVHELKIDREFIKGIPSDTHNIAIAKTVLLLADSLGFQVTAEGVETRQQLQFLQSQSCHTYQGFLASKPLNAAFMEQYAFQHRFRRISARLRK